MEADKKPEDNKEKQDAPQTNTEEHTPDTGSLTKPTDDKGSEKTDAADSSPDSHEGGDSDDQPAAKPNSLKQTLKRFWLYLVIALLLATVGGIFAVVSSLNGKKTPPPSSVQSQTLSQNQLKQLAKSGVSTNGQTVTIQGNAVLDGQELVRGNLYVAGGIQSGGTLNVPTLTISNTGSLGNAQASKLQVSKTATLQGIATLAQGLNVNGNTSISNASIGTLTATKLIMSGNGVITVPHHLMFTGAFPYRTISFGVLGNGGSASVNGSDTNGTVSINTGNNPQPGCFITVIFLVPFPHTPNILLGPIGLGAGAIEYSVQLVTDPTTNDTTAFKICTANTPLPNQAFGFSYLVDGSPF